jgi:hypothetical protein
MCKKIKTKKQNFLKHNIFVKIILCINNLANFYIKYIGFFSLAGIKKPSCILINISYLRDFLLTNTQNGMQR